ncbi:MAG TPA: hypothetical protein VMH22_12935 [bacterium]|nr:hypothetical protein [bacterium]
MRFLEYGLGHGFIVGLVSEDVKAAESAEGALIYNLESTIWNHVTVGC